MKKQENGQAVIELTIMLVALTAVLLGVLFVCSITTDNNTRLLRSKFEAERAARDPDADLISHTREFKTWSGTNRYGIPFGLDYRSHFTDANTVAGLSGHIHTAGDSANPLYAWETPGDHQLNFSLENNTVNALDAAQLVSKKDVRRGLGLDDFLDGDKDEAAGSLRQLARKWLGISVSESDIANNPSNRVYMPRLKEQKDLLQ